MDIFPENGQGLSGLLEDIHESGREAICDENSEIM